jgi:four helix bundle protein
LACRSGWSLGGGPSETKKPRTLNLEQTNPLLDKQEAGRSKMVAQTAKRYDLEERLLEFAAIVIDVSEKLPNTRAGNHIAGQFLRSGTSPYGNHGEAQSPESTEDFIHKMKICLKELRESRRWGRLIHKKGWLSSDPQLVFILRESDELIRIFKASVQTAERNRSAKRRITRSETERSSEGH